MTQEEILQLKSDGDYEPTNRLRYHNTVLEQFWQPRAEGYTDQWFPVDVVND